MGYVLLVIFWAIGAYGSYHCLWAAVGRKRYEFWMSKNEVKKTSIEMMALAIVMPFLCVVWWPFFFIDHQDW